MQPDWQVSWLTGHGVGQPSQTLKTSLQWQLDFTLTATVAGSAASDIPCMGQYHRIPFSSLKAQTRLGTIQFGDLSQ